MVWWYRYGTVKLYIGRTCGFVGTGKALCRYILAVCVVWWDR